MSQLDKELRERIDEPVSEEAEREVRLSPAEAVAQMRIKVPAQRNRKLRTLLERVNADDGLKAWWHVSNVNAVKRLGINDHSWVHIQIVANIGLRLLRILDKRGVKPAMVEDYEMKQEDAEVVVLLGALLHCVGMSVHRDRHEDWSLFLAEPKARELLAGIYAEPELTVVVSEVLQAITSHRESGHPLTLEAGIVRVADALDIEEGRSRIPFERGQVSIHSISAAAIDEVIISEGHRPSGLDRDQDEQLGRDLPGGRAAEVEAARLGPGAVRRDRGADRERGREEPRADVPARVAT